MPIYEFYCKECNTIFNFFSRSVNTDKKPLCPRCKQTILERKMSTFATISRGKGKEDTAEPNLDEAKMGEAMSLLAHEANRFNENDPKQVASLMRKLSHITGVQMGKGMEEAIRRIESGEDPEKIEAEMEGLMGGEEPFLLDEKKEGRSKPSFKPPSVDDTLYEL
jgi:putative FmdB family regulatory protein